MTEHKKASLSKISLVILVVILIGGGWFYFSKRSDCEPKISYYPSATYANGYRQDARYELITRSALASLGGRPKFATHEEAMSACLQGT